MTLRIASAGLAAATAAVLMTTPAQAARQFTVDSTADRPDAKPGDGVCEAAGGGCTLRAAIMEADKGSDDRIAVPAGRFTLSVKPPLGRAFADYTLLDAASGSLKVLAPMTITGAGRDQTILDGGGLDRVLTLLKPSTVTDLTITGGDSAPDATPYPYYGGGGVLNTSRLVMERVHVTGNTSTFGGGIFNIPGSDFVLRDSLVDANTAGEAGGIRVDWTSTIERSTISGNRVVNPHVPSRPGELAGLGGGIDYRGLGGTITDSRITGNHADDGGGGLNITFAYFPDPGSFLNGLLSRFGAQVQLTNTVVSGNTDKNGPSSCRAVLARITDPEGACGS
jgi:CSLREA domain-containing protein